jgi:hypothetical protein
MHQLFAFSFQGIVVNTEKNKFSSISLGYLQLLISGWKCQEKSMEVAKNDDIC